MKDITRHPKIEVTVIENNKGRLYGVAKDALTEKDKLMLVDEIIRVMFYFCELWKIDPALRIMHQEKVIKLEKVIEEKTKEREKKKRA
jgi:hypothetical protein